jgi:hypothetical protein
MNGIVDDQIKLVEADLQLLRDSNAVSENKRDVGLQRTVNEEMRSIKEEVARLGRVVSEA